MNQSVTLPRPPAQALARVLHLEDDPLDAKLIAAQLNDEELQIEVQWVKTAAELFEEYEKEPCDLVLLDYRLRGETGLEVLQELKRFRSPPPCIVLSGEIGSQYGVECLHAGAVDFVLKDRPARLGPAIRRALDAESERARVAKLESLLQQRERLESLGLLAGSVAQDFNDLLGEILSLTDAASAYLPPDHPARGLLHRTQHAGARAAKLTRRLSAFGQSQPLSPQRVELNAMVEETLVLFSRLAPPGWEVQLELDEGLRPVLVDPGQLQHVILSLCLTARDVMPEDGLLRVRTRREVLREGAPGLDPGTYARLDLTDSGPGIGVAELEHVFSPLCSLQGASGASLGLAGALGTLSQSGGDLQVTSALGEGSTYSVLLPEIEPTSPAGAETYERSRLLASKPYRLLVVDEDDLVRNLACDYLGALGYRVETASTGAQALDRVHAEASGGYDAVVADVVLPDLSGRQVVRAARARHPKCQAVYTSCYIRESVFEGGLLESGGAFLQKPLRLAALASLLKKHLE